MLNILLLLFALLFLFSIYYFEGLKGTNKYFNLALVCIIVSVIIGVRDPNGFSDTAGYAQDYISNAKSITELQFSDGPGLYQEMGFYYLGVISKTLYDSPSFYLLFVSLITFLVLYFCLKEFSILPFIGLYVYLGRFVGRNTVQIRAAIALAIVIWGTIYVTKRKLWSFLFVIFIASRFHTSAYVALPLYLTTFVHIKRNTIYWGVFVALLVSFFYGGVINSIVSQSELANEWARSYVQEGSEKAFSSSLLNPIIWYQIFLLFSFTSFEDTLSKMTPHYYMIRNAYFYSTIILIVLIQYAVLAARTSTIFATFEIAIVPMLLMKCKGTSRSFVFFGTFLLYFLFFYYNIRKDF